MCTIVLAHHASPIHLKKKSPISRSLILRSIGIDRFVQQPPSARSIRSRDKKKLIDLDQQPPIARSVPRSAYFHQALPTTVYHGLRAECNASPLWSPMLQVGRGRRSRSVGGGASHAGHLFHLLGNTSASPMNTSPVLTPARVA